MPAERGEVATLAALIRKHAHALAGRRALTTVSGAWTFADLDRRSSQVAHALAAEGVGAQDRVAFWGKNSSSLFELLFGAAKINAVTVVVNWRLAASEVAFILNDCAATVVVVGREFEPVLRSLDGQLPTVKKVIVDDDDFAGWMAAAPERDPGLVAAPEDVVLQLYTSGTTGVPKGVMITNRGLFAMLPGTAAAWWFDELTVNLVAMPLFHVGGVGWALVGMLVGAHTVLLREADPAQILQVIPEHRVTHVLFVPAVLQILLSTPGVAETDFSSLRFIVYGASPISVDLLVRSLETFGCDFIQGYGLTETCGAVVHLLPQDHDPTGPHLHRLRSAGRPMPGAEARVVEPGTSTACGTGQVGEIQLRADQLMKGYWNRPGDTEAAFDDGGWLRTGDAGYIDSDGYLFISDRVKDMIISGGENVYPAEIENTLMAHPAVADVAVIGVPSDRWGETPLALVVKAPGSDPDPTDLIAHCRQHLAGYKAPSAVEFVDSLPRNPTGKILKHELRGPYWAGRSRAVN